MDAPLDPQVPLAQVPAPRGAGGWEDLALLMLQVSEQETQDYWPLSCPDPGFLEE